MSFNMTKCTPKIPKSSKYLLCMHNQLNKINSKLCLCSGRFIDGKNIKLAKVSNFWGWQFCIKIIAILITISVMLSVIRYFD